MTLWERIAIAVALAVLTFIGISRIMTPGADPTLLILAAVACYSAAIIIIIFGGRTYH